MLSYPFRQGYNLLAVDDFWGAENRNASNQIVGDPTRFPSGMRALGDYIHSKGLLYGLCKC
jgi:alpha-galactosidase